MFDKVIIAEDHESQNLTLQRTFEELRIAQADYAFYCDDALKKIQMAKQKGEPYELLITDLSFEEDGSPQAITDGEGLIAAARAIQPEIMILVFSVKKEPAIVDKLFKTLEIDGYVSKGRNDVKELKLAVEKISRGQKHYPQTLGRSIQRLDLYEFSEYDIKIIQLLAEGKKQNTIPAYLKENNISPSSLSSIEKRLNLIREACRCSNNEQLVLHCKERGIL